MAKKGEKLSEETKSKIRLAKLGKTFSEETKSKMRAAALGRKLSEETKAKIRSALVAICATEESKAKMSKASRGRKLSEVHKAKLLSVHLGRSHTEESKAKMRAAHLGRKLSKETKAKMSAAARAYNESEERRRAALEKKIKTNPSMAKGPTHYNSLVFKLRSPQNVVYYVQNLTHWVRRNAHLFAPEDVVWKPLKSSLSRRTPTYRCRAEGGLYALTNKVRPVGSWKGWTLVSDVERLYAKGEDLLHRQYEEEPVIESKQHAI